MKLVRWYIVRAKTVYKNIPFRETSSVAVSDSGSFGLEPFAFCLISTDAVPCERQLEWAYNCELKTFFPKVSMRA